MRTRNLLPGLCLFLFSLTAAYAQDYRNLVNTRFNTVASGPMQTLVVDVANPADQRAVRDAVIARVRAARAARESAIQWQVDQLRRSYRIKGEMTAGVPDIVVLRQSGRLAVPPTMRTRAANDLTFTFPAPTESGAWKTERQNDLATIVNIMYGELKSIYGPPSWSGTVKIVDADAINPIMSDRNALSGGVYNVSTNEILLPEYQTPQSTILTLTQMMAIAFHGPASISYDAWERGMARAATLRAVGDVLAALQSAPAQSFTGFAHLGDNLDVADPLWQAMDLYDLLNQPPLGNDRFFPVALTSQPLADNSIGGMLIPRLRMSSSAWIKVATEDPGFFASFNALYYSAVAANPNIKNSVPDLKALAKQALAADGAASVEGLEFMDWYQRQYVLDTSVSPGVKEYGMVSLGSRPTTTDDYGIVVTIVYYQTAFDTSGNGTEVALVGTSYPIYWDFAFLNRLYLGPQYEILEVGRYPAPTGEGSIIPVFPNTLGGDPNLASRMRVTMDFPINASDVRLVVAPRSMGPAASPNNFWGTVVGADTGTMQIVTETGASATFDVKQGAFGGALPDTAFTRPNRATLTFTNAATNQTTVRRVNVGWGSLVPVFYAADPVDTRTHLFPAGPAMVSFPIQPLQPKAADALLDPTTGSPLFNDTNLLMAQWQQNLSGTDKYVRYPTMEPLQPGKGYWSSFPSSTRAKLVGRVCSQDPNVSIGLVHGWNQIGNPFEIDPSNTAGSNIDVASLMFQYQANNQPVNLATAIANGWVSAQTVPSVGQVAIWEYDQGFGYGAATVLKPWVGYWIRVNTAEGLTITYPNPTVTISSRAAGVTRAASPVMPKGWSVPIMARGPDGTGGTAYIGQADGALPGYDARLDALRPPDFTRAVPTVVLPHPDWGANAGDYYSDIRRTGSVTPWEITVTTPDPTKTYTLTWSNLATVPRSTRLMLIDTATGNRLYMESTSSYSFRPGTSPTRSFRIVPEQRGRGALRIMNLVVQPTRAAGSRVVQVAYDLSQGATVTAEVVGATGRVIRHLAPGRAAPSGTNSLSWDTRDDQAISVPAGMYMLTLTARTPEGESARVAQPLVVIR